MMNEINKMLMALDEMGFIVERVMDEFIQIFDENENLILTGDFKSVQPYEELLKRISNER